MSESAVITVGNFDGVHAGHQTIVQRARKMADARSAKVVALTFEPHPAALLRPDRQPPSLMTLEARKRALRAAGADEVEVLEPTRDLLALSPEDFVSHLRESHHMVGIVEGHDFRFGKARAGDTDMLSELGKSQGFAVDIVPPIEKPLTDQIVVTVSSSIVRWLVGRGRVADAACCLNRPYALEADVAHGEQRGRQIGVPTANLDAQQIDRVLIPADGVYAGLATLPDGSVKPAAISVGVKPTFGRRQLTVEAHLLGHHGDLYGRRIELSFTRWLRDQMPFRSIDLLKAQLQRDIAEVAGLHAAGLLQIHAGASV